MRNCYNNYPVKDKADAFKFQFKYKHDILYQCPASYFDDIIIAVYVQHSELVLRKKLGIVTRLEEISLLEMTCYNIIESEMSKAEDAKMKSSQPKDKNNVN